MTEMTGARAVAECIRRESVEHAFCVPGESYLGIIDALYECEDVTLISDRQEGGAAFAAEAYAKASGGVGVCLVTRGPGACNASIGVHTARQDSTPMVLFVGQVERKDQHREGFQEVDFEAFFGPLAKWAVEVRETSRIPELVHRAFHVARSGRPGPVVVSLPQDVLEEHAQMDFANPYTVASPEPSLADARRIVEALASTEKAMVIAGGGVIRARAQAELMELSERLDLPVFSAFRRHDAFPNHHPNYLGHLGLSIAPEQRRAIEEAEVVLALGTRLSEITTQGYSLLSAGQKLLHVDVDPSVFGSYRAPCIAVVADARKALQCMLRSCEGVDLSPPETRAAWVKKHRGFYESYSDPLNYFADDADYVDGARMVKETMEILPEDAIVTVDAGNFAGWVQRFYQFRCPGTFIGPTSGAMGYGMPAALGAKLASPHRTVVSFSGDGGFMMTFGELETAVRQRVPFIAVIVNNNMYGTIRTHQEMVFPERVHATDLTNPSFAATAELFGAHGEQVKESEDFSPALRRALSSAESSGKPAVVEVMTGPSQLTVTATVEDLRSASARSEGANS